MKIDERAIKTYIICGWYDRSSNDFFYGIDVVMKDGNRHHCADDNGPIQIANKKDALKEIKRLNNELTKLKPNQK